MATYSQIGNVILANFLCLSKRSANARAKVNNTSGIMTMDKMMWLIRIRK